MEVDFNMVDLQHAIDDDEIDRIALNLERGLYGPWELRRLILECRSQRRVLRHLFDLFQATDVSDLRQQSDSIRSLNLTALKREVGMEQHAP